MELALHDVESMLDEEIERVHSILRGHKPGTPEYETTLKCLNQLYSTKKDVESSEKISADTKALIVANLAGILLILSYEKMNVISTKALNFVMKGRI